MKSLSEILQSSLPLISADELEGAEAGGDGDGNESEDYDKPQKPKSKYRYLFKNKITPLSKYLINLLSQS